MSRNSALVVIGIVLILVGVAKLGSSRGSFNLSNIGISIGSTNTQTNKVGNVGPVPPTKKPDWVGLAIAVIGVITALIGLFSS
jgi:hypothetical protein